jgi:hypothetical protein
MLILIIKIYISIGLFITTTVGFVVRKRIGVRLVDCIALLAILLFWPLMVIWVLATVREYMKEGEK